MAKTELMESERWQLIGLKAIAQSLWKKIEAAKKAATEITDEQMEYGSSRAADWLFEEGEDIDDLVKHLVFDSQVAEKLAARKESTNVE